MRKFFHFYDTPKGTSVDLLNQWISENPKIIINSIYCVPYGKRYEWGTCSTDACHIPQLAILVDAMQAEN